MFYMLLTLLVLLWGKYKTVLAKKLNIRLSNENKESTENQAQSVTPAPPKKRLRSLDTFRG
jgi:hypothetical protein